MLALPRIVAAESGLGNQNRASPSGKAAGATNNPFSKLLAGFRSGKATTRPATDGKAVSGGKVPVEPSSGASIARDIRAVLDRKASPKAADSGLRETGFHGQAIKSNASPRDSALKTGKDLRPRKTEKASDGLDASLVAAALNPAAGKSASSRLDPGSGGRAGNGDNESGIERLGVREERGEGGAKVTVVDMRLKAARDVADKRGSAKARPEGETGDETAKGNVSATKAEADPSAFAGRVVARVDEGSAAGSPVATSPEPTPQASADSLGARLRDGAADIVRSAQIVLRDGNSGIIRLRLEPESLGGVKIELKMAEKQISGKIVVESDIAGEAFRSSIDALKDAFAECGFETTALEVEVRNGMASGTGGDRGDGSESDGPYRSRSLKELDAAVPPLAMAGRDGLLDVIV
ncbi:MAG: hypothetical protein CVV47_05710 [Spirochaetae bacterium HGW-Spirochaetae-3]|jgi:hypothetical protein|nr:MAG: hypothetical protein CVV47_05710 [Spirochaetae bacterium HGW-Spirochaetae-3]